MYAARMAAEARARGDEAKARYWDRIRAQVDQAPPFCPEQCSRLAVLLRADAAPSVVRSRRPMPHRPAKADQYRETSPAAPVATTGTAA